MGKDMFPQKNDFNPLTVIRSYKPMLFVFFGDLDGEEEGQGAAAGISTLDPPTPSLFSLVILMARTKGRVAAAGISTLDFPTPLFFWSLNGKGEWQGGSGGDLYAGCYPPVSSRSATDWGKRWFPGE